MDYNYPMMNGYNDGFGIFMMLFWGVIIVVIIVVVLRLLRHHEASTNNKTSPLDIVKERYAKGDITKEQFEELKKGLK
jgi:putative membrane protein